MNNIKQKFSKHLTFVRKYYKIRIKKILPKSLTENLSYFTYFIQNGKFPTNTIKKSLSDWCKIWKHPSFPFQWANEYTPQKFFSYEDKECGLFFAENQGIKLYFSKRRDDIERCQTSAAAAAVEQDLLSPHRYVTKENKMWGTLERAENEIPQEIPFFVEKGDIVADIGASHGNFSISVIENAKHIYLFEPDKIWNKPIEKTFEKYKDKITIINKYVSDKDDETSVTLDSFFKDTEVNFIKADVEGDEKRLLEGAKNLLSTRNNIKCSICTYHNPQDAKDFNTFFRELGYKTYFTDGCYFMPINNTENNTSFLRKGVIRATKQQ